MKELWNEYGSILLGTGAAVLLLLMVLKFLFGGDIYQAIQEFSKSIC